MALRDLIDAHGRHWNVWAVKPQVGAPAFPAASPLEQAEFCPGWLTFECKSPPLLRRLAPFPGDWAELPDAELARLCDAAAQVPPRRPLNG